MCLSPFWFLTFHSSPKCLLVSFFPTRGSLPGKTRALDHGILENILRGEKSLQIISQTWKTISSLWTLFNPILNSSLSFNIFKHKRHVNCPIFPISCCRSLLCWKLLLRQCTIFNWKNTVCAVGMPPFHTQIRFC